MKIVKFNEKNNIPIFKDFEKLENILDQIDNLNVQKQLLENRIYPLLLEYFKLNPDRFFNEFNDFSFDNFKITGLWFYNTLMKFGMSFRYDNEYYEDEEIFFSHEEYKDMKDFIKNPEAYKSIKKYNI